MIKNVILFFALISFFIFPQTIFAHVLQTDGSIGVVFHTDPDDDPIAEQPTAFFFHIKDRQNKFSFEKCQCEVTVSEHGKTINTQTITKGSTTYTFPKEDNYKVIFSGQPKTNEDFQKFALTYDVSVTHDNKPQVIQKPSTNATQFPFMIKAGSVLLFIICITLLIIKKKKPSKDTDK